MKGTGAGWDSCLYRIFIVFGLLGIVGGTVITALTQPPNSKLPLYVGVGGVMLFLLVSMGYWAIQIVLKGYNNLKVPDMALRGNVNDLSILQNWDKLFSAMTLPGVDIEAVKKAVRMGNASMIIWFLWLVVIGLCPIMLMIPYIFELLPWGFVAVGVVMYIGLVFFMMILTAFLANRTQNASNIALFGPLGLKLTVSPRVFFALSGPKVRGGSVAEGMRHGRAVRVTFGILNTDTQVACPSPGFSITSNGGELQAEAGAPQAVNEALRGLQKAAYWQGLQIQSDANSLTASRDGGVTTLWLYDLWLIERIINELEKRQS